MILHVLDENLVYRGRLEAYKSLTWKEQYQGEGGFSLTVEDTTRNAALLRHGWLLYRADRKTAMHIVNIARSTARSEISATGYTELVILNRRAMLKTYTVTDAESGMYGVVSQNLRGLPVESAPTAGFGQQWDGVLEEMSLLDAVCSVGKYSGLGVKMIIDVNAQKRVFTVYQGQDRTYSPETGGRVFSQEYGNLRELTVTEDDDLYKNVAYVRGFGQDEKQKQIVIGETEGLERREMLVKVATQSSKQTASEYQAEMHSAGQNALQKQRHVQTFEAEISPDMFGKAYDLGDLVTCNAKRYGLRFDRRISEFTQTVENGVNKIVLTLGEPVVSYAESITVKGNTVSGVSAVDAALAAYPVGSIYMSVNQTDPADLFGGTWERIQDSFLLAAGSTYAAGETGGEATVTLTVDEMPSHAHNMEYSTDNGETWNNRSLGKDGTSSAERYGGLSTSVTSYATYRSRIGYTGGDNAHNNMPPYLAVYIWKRTA